MSTTDPAPAGVVPAALAGRHDACWTSRRGCLNPDVSPAGVAETARHFAALTAAQRAQGYRHAGGYQHVSYFAPVVSGPCLNERCFIRACDGTFTRVTDPAWRLA